MPCPSAVYVVTAFLAVCWCLLLLQLEILKVALAASFSGPVAADILSAGALPLELQLQCEIACGLASGFQDDRAGKKPYFPDVLHCRVRHQLEGLVPVFACLSRGHDASLEIAGFGSSSDGRFTLSTEKLVQDGYGALHVLVSSVTGLQCRDAG